MRFLVSQVRLNFMGRVSRVEKKVYVVSQNSGLNGDSNPKRIR